jgi:hypothetical protein
MQTELYEMRYQHSRLDRVSLKDLIDLVAVGNEESCSVGDKEF